MKTRPATRRADLSAPVSTHGAWSDLIRRRCGLGLRDAQVPVLAALLQARMRVRGLTSPAAYYDLLDAEPEGGPEWAELMDRLVSHETSFFRHMASFEAIRSQVVPDLRGRARMGQTLTFWSAGCSTGQEAYSLAMAAMDDGVSGGRFTVWGADISRRAIETARSGRYSERAIDDIPPAYRQRYFRPVAGPGPRQFEVVEELRDRVRFVSANLYTACAMFLSYDVIVCQNVLIYFAQSAIPNLVSMLGARLSPGGYLLFGPGESPAECPRGLEAINVNGVRAFRRVGRTAVEVRS